MKRGAKTQPPDAEWFKLLSRLIVVQGEQASSVLYAKWVLALRKIAEAARDMAFQMEVGNRVDESALGPALGNLFVGNSFREFGNPMAERYLKDSLAMGLRRFQLERIAILSTTTADELRRTALACAWTADHLEGTQAIAHNAAARIRDSGRGDGGALPNVARHELAKWAEKNRVGPRTIARWFVDAGIKPSAESWLPAPGTITGPAQEDAIAKWEQLLTADRRRLRRKGTKT